MFWDGEKLCYGTPTEDVLRRVPHFLIEKRMSVSVNGVDVLWSERLRRREEWDDRVKQEALAQEGFVTPSMMRDA